MFDSNWYRIENWTPTETVVDMEENKHTYIKYERIIVTKFWLLSSSSLLVCMSACLFHIYMMMYDYDVCME